MYRALPRLMLGMWYHISRIASFTQDNKSPKQSGRYRRRMVLLRTPFASHNLAQTRTVHPHAHRWWSTRNAWKSWATVAEVPA